MVAAINAGKHVFVEKPLAVNAGQLEAVAQALTSNPSNLLTVGFNRRFAPLAQRLQAFLAARSGGAGAGIDLRRPKCILTALGIDAAKRRIFFRSARKAWSRR